MGFPWWLSGKQPSCQGGRHRFNTWAGKLPWRRRWQPTRVFLPEKAHRERRATGPGVTKSQTRPGDWATTITPLSIIFYPKYFPTFVIIRLVFQRQLCWDVVGISIQHTAHSKAHPKTSSDLCRHCETIVRMAGTSITSKRVLWPQQPLTQPRHPQVLNNQRLCSYTFSRVFYKWKYIACTLSCLTSCLSA